MKKKLLDSLKMFSKYFLYIMILQSMGLNLLMANNSKAQGIRSIRDVYLQVKKGETNPTEMLRFIEANSDFRFTYDSKVITDDVIFEINHEKVTVADILMTIAENTSLVFRQYNENIDIKRNPKPQPDQRVVVIENNLVSGKVTDESGEGLPGASVRVKGASLGTITDIDGNFEIDVPDDATTITISYVGFQTQEIDIAGRSVIEISLALDIESLDEVVVVGYGTQKKSDITGSVVSVQEYRLKDVPNTNFTQALQGSVPGVFISNNSAGAENGDVNIRIRGANSLTANNNPLIILDGIPFAGGISQINQNDIKSIEVLKDVSSSAIYGSRGANGVILITTKEGKKGAPVIEYAGYAGFQEVINKPDFMNGQEFADWKVEFLGGTSEDYSVLTQTEQDVLASMESVDWVDEATRTAFQQQHQLSVSSATDNTKYYISGTFMGIEGVSVGDKFERYNLRLNLEQKISNIFTVGTNTQLGYINRGGVTAGFDGAINHNPLTLNRDENGELIVDGWPDADIDLPNPLNLTLADDEDKEYTVFSNTYLNVDVPGVKGLTYRLNTGIEYSSRNRNTYLNRSTFEGERNNGILFLRESGRQGWTIENIIQYKRTFGDHTIDLTGLYSAQHAQRTQFEDRGEGFPSDKLTFFQAENAETYFPNNRPPVYRVERVVSQMFRANYSFKGKYLLTLTGRRDGASVFGANNKYAFFPSAAIGWNIIEEPFLVNSTVVSNLKLRVSAGQIGNQAIQPYGSLAALNSENYVGGNNGDELAPGFISSSLGTQSLTWETTTSFNYGVDFGFFGDRIQGSIDYYVSTTDDLLNNRTIPPINGARTILQNIGKTENKGLEVLLSGVLINSGDFKWTADLNFSFNRNKVLETFGDGQPNINNGWFVGQPIGQNYGLEFGGIWQESDSVLMQAFNDLGENYQFGDVRVKDIDADTLITTNDETILRSIQPDFIAGLGSTFSYKNVSLSFFINTVQGVYRENEFLVPNGTNNGNSTARVYTNGNRNGPNKTWWTPENPINDWPRNNVNNNPENVVFYEDASYIRLRDVTLSYNFSDDILPKSVLSQLRVYATVRNLFTWTDWSGLDPEFAGTTPNAVDGNGVTNQFSGPQSRTFIFGINATIK